MQSHLEVLFNGLTDLNLNAYFDLTQVDINLMFQLLKDLRWSQFSLKDFTDLGALLRDIYFKIGEISGIHEPLVTTGMMFDMETVLNHKAEIIEITHAILEAIKKVIDILSKYNG